MEYCRSFIGFKKDSPDNVVRQYLLNYSKNHESSVFGFTDGSV